MAVSFVDRCIFQARGVGPGDFVVNGAVLGYMTPAQANAVNGATYHAIAQTLDGHGNIQQWEISTGIYNAGVQARTTIIFSSSANAKVNFVQAPQVMLGLLAEDIGASPDIAVIAQGQNMTAGTPFVVPPATGRIYVNKPIAEPTYIQFGNASAQLFDVLVKDVAGTADGAGNGIFNTVTADGVVNPTITVPYGGFFFRPVASLNTWTLGTS